MMDSQVQCVLWRHSPRVSSKMAAVLAVATLLLLCSSIQSAAQEVQATITQVKSSDFSTSTTPPAITTATEGSSDTHSAVLANAALGAEDHGPLVLVDLARADQENMTSMTAPSPTADFVPAGFDMNEFDDADAESLAAAQDDGTLVEGYPVIGNSEDNSHGSGYGVQTYSASSDATEVNPSFASATTEEDPSSFATQEEGSQGTLVEGYPVISNSEDNSHGSGYGVQTYDAASDATEVNPSFASATTEEDPSSFATENEGSQGTLVEGYPVIGNSEDNSHGSGYGVQTYDAASDATEVNPSFASATTKEDPSSFATEDEGSQGTLVAGYPVIGNSEDNSHGSGYGVQTYGASSDATDVNPSFASTATEEEESSLFATQEDEGTLVEGYPVISNSEDNSHGSGYGVQTYGAAFDATDVNPSFASTTIEEDSFATQDEGSHGTLVEGYPVISNSEDNSQGQGYDALSTQANEYPGSDSFAVYGQDIPDSTDNYALATPRTYRPMPSKPAAPAEAWRKGRCTYYGGMDATGTMSGACGYGNLYTSGYGVYTAALSAKLFNNGLACGACYEIACSGKGRPCKAGSIVVTATNFCPPTPGQSSTSGGWCNPPNEHFDLSYPAFSKIADPRAGIVPLQFRRVPCKKLGGIRYSLNGNCNFNLVTITNVGASGVVIEAYMKGDNMTWAPLSRTWGSNWQCGRNYCGKGISIKIVTSDKKVSVSKVADKDWTFGKTYVGQQVK